MVLRSEIREMGGIIVAYGKGIAAGVGMHCPPVDD